MNKFFLSILLVFIICCRLFAQQLIVVVAPFEIRAGFSQSEAEVIEYLFINELAKSDIIRVLDQSDVMYREVLRRMEFELSDWSNPNKVAEFGRALNANAVVLGRMMMLSNERIISVRINDLNTEIRAVNDMVVTNISEIRGLLPAFTAEIVNRLPKPPEPVQIGYRLGDTGPGGGIVFIIEGNRHLEYYKLPGSYTWNEARNAAPRYRGGGFNNWRLPTINELRFLFGNLRMNAPRGDFWSSESAPRERFKAMARSYHHSAGVDTTEITWDMDVLVVRIFYR